MSAKNTAGPKSDVHYKPGIPATKSTGGAKYPSGPARLKASLAAGESLAKATSEGRVGGSKGDKSHGTNK